MTNRELSQVIRKDLKEHGITSKDVSVRVRDLFDVSIVLIGSVKSCPLESPALVSPCKSSSDIGIKRLDITGKNKS